MVMSKIRTALSLSVVLVYAALAACGGGRTTLSAADLPMNGSGAQQADYVIGPGDSLQIFVWDQPDLSTNVQVRPDGRISTPLVEDLEAAGRTPTELAREVETVLAEYVRMPVVTVIVQSFVGESGRQVRVVGEAAEPRALQYREGMTVLDVMIEVGGLSETASGNRARIIRRMDGEEVEIRVRLEDLLNEGSIDQNVRMQPGDVLVIPQSVL